MGPRVPQVLNTDRVALKRIIHNLIDNALKFTEKGSIRIQVTADSSALRFAVIDTGIGIADENHAELFDSYTQVHEFHTRSIQGSGLGLALTQKLVKLLGGEIGLSSGLGAGSEFWFTLPLTTSTEAGQ